MNLKQAKNFRMPWGNHKNCLLGLLPLDYLQWVATNFNQESIKTAAKIVLKDRSGLTKPTKPTKATKNSKSELAIQTEGLDRHDFRNGAFGELKKLLDKAPPGLF